MKKFITIIILIVSVCVASAQDKPGNNLGKILSMMRQEFPELRYLGSDDAGDRYQD